MNTLALIMEIYVKEHREESALLLKDLLACAESANLSVITERQCHRKVGKMALADHPRFNVIEGDISVDAEPDFLSPIRVRYRPAVLSKTWAPLEMPEPDTVPAISSSVEQEEFEFYLSLISFQNSSRARNETRSAVLQLFAAIPPNQTAPKAIVGAIERFFPALLTMHAWGYSNLAPFRNLTAEQEWEIVRTSALEPESKQRALSTYQCVFFVTGTVPPFPILEACEEHGKLTVCEL